MPAASFEHGQEVRQALRAIVSDPAHGSAALDNPRILASLLSDLMPDAPRESGVLLAAAEKNAPAVLRDHVRQGMDIGTAINLTASALASTTAFGPEVCEWVTTEFAIALDLVDAKQQSPGPQPDSGQPIGPLPTAQASPLAVAFPQNLATEAAAKRPTGAAESTRPPAAVRSFAFSDAVPRRRRPAAVAVLASAVILALALAGYALYRVSAFADSAAGGTPPANSPHGTPRASSTTPDSPGFRAAPPSWSGIWIAQLASVPVSAGQARLNSVLARVRLQVPSAQVLKSTDYASLNPYFWVVYYADGFSDGTRALGFCTAQGLTSRNQCLGRYLSHDRADFSYQCYPPAAAPTPSCSHPPAPPAAVVESYLTSVNARNWAQAWQLGGKNLGQSYSQMVAGYRQTSRVLISHLAVSGDAVSVKALAYETDGAVQRYALNYDVRDGVIVAGRSTLIATG